MPSPHPAQDPNPYRLCFDTLLISIHLDSMALLSYRPRVNPRHHYALIVLCLLAGPSAWAQVALKPQAGLLVLRNGQVLHGEITQAGDYYVVTLGETGEVRLKTAEVEALCGSLEEAYEFKVRRLSGTSAAQHLELAEWCLRHNLTGRSAEQVVAASRLAPDDPRLKLIERRLELAVSGPVAGATSTAAVGAATVSQQQLEKTLGELPSGSIEKFAAIVQPLLMNRCGANQCHGPNARSDFRLLKPPPGQLANRRFTQRNLYATLPYLDKSAPEKSPLLDLPQRRHGTSLAPVFDKHSAKQLAELTAWVKLVTLTDTPASTVPPTIVGAPATLSQPITAVPPANVGTPSATTDSLPSVQAMRPPLEAPSLATGGESKPDEPTPASDRFIPRDRYDAELFNREYHQP